MESQLCWLVEESKPRNKPEMTQAACAASSRTLIFQIPSPGNVRIPSSRGRACGVRPDSEYGNASLFCACEGGCVCQRFLPANGRDRGESHRDDAYGYVPFPRVRGGENVC
jgi:hypothetical protein